MLIMSFIFYVRSFMMEVEFSGFCVLFVQCKLLQPMSLFGLKKSPGL